jgi:hypothetical protein
MSLECLELINERWSRMYLKESSENWHGIWISPMDLLLSSVLQILCAGRLPSLEDAWELCCSIGTCASSIDHVT